MRVPLDTQPCAYGDGGVCPYVHCACVCAGREEAGGGRQRPGQTASEATDEAGPQLGQAHARGCREREGRTASGAGKAPLMMMASEA